MPIGTSTEAPFHLSISSRASQLYSDGAFLRAELTLSGRVPAPEIASAMYDIIEGESSLPIREGLR